MSEQETQNSHHELKYLMQTYVDVAQEVLFSLDASFKLISLNRFATDKLNMQCETLLGRSFNLLTRHVDEQMFIQSRLQKFAHSDVNHLQFTMHWSLPAGQDYEMAIQLSKFNESYIGSAKDLSDTLTTIEELYEAQTNFETLIEHNLNGILITDHNGIILFANQAAADLMYYDKDNLIGIPFGFIQPMQSTEKFEIDFLRPGQAPGRAEVSTITTVWREEPANLIIIHDITDLHEAKKRIEEMAYFDDLTKLPNRAFFMRMLEKTIYRYERHGGGFALLFMDLNDFKSINDSYGHASGDLLLHQVSERLRNAFREEDLVARIGGDEFTAIVEGTTNLADIKNLCLKITNSFKKNIQIGDHQIHTQPSIGISLYPDSATTPDMLLSQADIAMYHAKKSGYKPFSFFDASMLNLTTQKATQKGRIFEALENREFCLFFQPQQNLHTSKINSFEALIRWKHPEKGLIPPDQFIPILEQTGLIIEVGHWIFDTVIELLEHWQKTHQPLYKISINVSPIQLYEQNFVQYVLERIQKSSISPQWLALEVTESVFISNMIHTRQMILELQSAGLEVHMDDFGSGYSSFSELKNLPFDVIKIDQEFIRQMDNDPRDVILVEAMISALHGLEKKIIAEGIENEKQREILKQLGCDQIQGYLLSKPKPIEEALKEIPMIENTFK
ncbi:EAL and GGDEF domain-containing protein [Thiomicrorhabdus indica]|uniref:sensor domain-containing protein n=1 Tax=Thiomicrorhabdus indica TaxID=2267253 RepID=UPI00102D6D7C|nr:EAL domain-containing protein [Thiomicrorhabdus indica]